MNTFFGSSEKQELPRSKFVSQVSQLTQIVMVCSFFNNYQIFEQKGVEILRHYIYNAS